MPCILAVVRERGGLCVSDVVQVSDMVEAGRATASDFFSIFGYTVNKVVVGSRANCDFHICTAAEATPAGAPLLVLPLSRCWTASSAEATCRLEAASSADKVQCVCNRQNRIYPQAASYQH